MTATCAVAPCTLLHAEVARGPLTADGARAISCTCLAQRCWRTVASYRSATSEPRIGCDLRRMEKPHSGRSAKLSRSGPYLSGPRRAPQRVKYACQKASIARIRPSPNRRSGVAPATQTSTPLRFGSRPSRSSRSRRLQMRSALSESCSKSARAESSVMSTGSPRAASPEASHPSLIACAGAEGDARARERTLVSPDRHSAGARSRAFKAPEWQQSSEHVQRH